MNKIERWKKKAFNASKACMRAATHLAEQGELLVDREAYEKRINTCSGCDLYEKYAKNECGDCLCYVKGAKAWLDSEYCPQYKWEGDYDKAPPPDEE